MIKVKRGTVKVMKRGRKKRHDQYLIDCIKAVNNTTDVMLTECRVPNTLTDKARVRSRIGGTQGSSKVSIGWLLRNDKVIPVLTKKPKK